MSADNKTNPRHTDVISIIKATNLILVNKLTWPPIDAAFTHVVDDPMMLYHPGDTAY